MSDLYGKGARGKATRLHAQLVRSRGRCQAAGYDGMPCSDRLECCHIIGRRFASTRTLETNALCMCSAHHRYYTEWPLQFRELVAELVGIGKYEELRNRAEQIKKVDWDAEVARLQGLLAKVDA